MVIDTSTSSACGGMTSGVLGCFNAPNAEITLIQGWSWYAGSDPTQIGAGQYDFETTVLHELGHALGLGGGTDPSSPMYETLTAGTTARVVTVADLNIPDPPAGADPQSAARLKTARPTTPAVSANPISSFAAVDIALASLDASGEGPASWLWPATDVQPGSGVLGRTLRPRFKISLLFSRTDPSAMDVVLR
jgi:hypothetical protein